MYHKSVNGQPVGPMSLEDLVRTGLRPDTLVWKQGTASWVRASELPEVVAALNGQQTAAQPQQMQVHPPQSYGAQYPQASALPGQGGKMTSVALLVLSILTALIGVLMLLGFLVGMAAASEEYRGYRSYAGNDEYTAIMLVLTLGLICALIVIIQSIMGIVISARRK